MAYSSANTVSSSFSFVHLVDLSRMIRLEQAVIGFLNQQDNEKGMQLSI